MQSKFPFELRATGSLFTGDSQVYPSGNVFNPMASRVSEQLMTSNLRLDPANSRQTSVGNPCDTSYNFPIAFYASHNSDPWAPGRDSGQSPVIQTHLQGGSEKYTNLKSDSGYGSFRSVNGISANQYEARFVVASGQNVTFQNHGLQPTDASYAPEPEAHTEISLSEQASFSCKSCDKPCKTKSDLRYDIRNETMDCTDRFQET